MIELIDEDEGNILAVRARGKLTEDDYTGVLIPRVESTLERAGKIRALFCMDETFQGWSMRAGWANTRLVLRHRVDFEKVAMIGAPAWEACCVQVANLVVGGRIKTFRRTDMHDAWEWLRA